MSFLCIGFCFLCSNIFTRCVVFSLSNTFDVWKNKAKQLADRDVSEVDTDGFEVELRHCFRSCRSRLIGRSRKGRRDIIKPCPPRPSGSWGHWVNSGWVSDYVESNWGLTLSLLEYVTSVRIENGEYLSLSLDNRSRYSFRSKGETLVNAVLHRDSKRGLVTVANHFSCKIIGRISSLFDW